MIWLLLSALEAEASSPELVLQRVQETSSLRRMLRDTTRPSVPEEAYRTAAGGSVATGTVSVSGYAHKKAWGVAVLDVPIARLWAAINDDRSKVAWTSLDYLALLDGQYCQAPRRVFQFLPVPMLTDRWWVVDIRYNDALASTSAGRVREMTWRGTNDATLPAETQAWADKGIPLASTQGGWLLIDIDGSSTLVEYYAWADPGGSVPASLANSFATSGIEDTLTTFRKLAVSGPSCPVR